MQINENKWKWQRPFIKENLLYSQTNQKRIQELSKLLEYDMQKLIDSFIGIISNKDWFQKMKGIVKILMENPNTENIAKLEIINICLLHIVEIRFYLWQDQEGLDELSDKNKFDIYQKINMTPVLNSLQSTIEAFLKNINTQRTL